MHPTLKDHLFVEFADLGAFGGGDAVQPPVGDRATARHGQELGAGAGCELAGDPVPGQTGAKLGKLVTRVPATQQVEETGDDVVGDVGKRVRPQRHRGDLGHR
jgi:hypothetical protein